MEVTADLEKNSFRETGGGLVTKLCLTLANPMSMGFSRQEYLGILQKDYDLVNIATSLCCEHVCF